MNNSLTVKTNVNIKKWPIFWHFDKNLPIKNKKKCLEIVYFYKGHELEAEWTPKLKK